MLRWHKGRLIMEIEALVRIPVMLEAIRPDAWIHGVRLTTREKQVLAGILDGLTNKEIARRLNISERTVKFHVSSLLQKFKVPHRMALVAAFHKAKQ